MNSCLFYQNAIVAAVSFFLLFSAGSVKGQDHVPDYIFTEFAFPADNEDAAFIEIFSENGKGQNIIPSYLDLCNTGTGAPEDDCLAISTLGESSATAGSFDDNGFFILCKDKAAFEAAYIDKTCQYQWPASASDWSANNYALVMGGACPEPEDVYGPIPNINFPIRRAVRKITETEYSWSFDQMQWELFYTNLDIKDMDPGVWKDPCVDDLNWKKKGKGGCADWVNQNKEERCPRYWKKCPRTCGKCPCQDNSFKFKIKGKKRDCGWVGDNLEKRCSPRAAKKCRLTCNPQLCA